MKQIHLSEAKLNQLASEIGNRLYESHYFNQDIISGEALNNFCDHEQINKFLLFQVYQVWQLQISRFKHPYFDFEHPEVNHLLAQLQNLLSRNISIHKDDFKPLLHKAVLNNLRLLTDPRTALQQFFFQNQDKISVELYEKYCPFFSDFDFVINSILKYYQKNEIKQAEKDVFLLKFDRVLEVFNQKSEQSDDTYRSLRFLKLTNRRLDEVIKEDEEERAAREIQERAAEERRKAEEIKVQEEARRKEEETKRKEEEAKRKEEEAILAAQAEKKKVQKSFFEEISAGSDSLIDLEEVEIEVENETVSHMPIGDSVAHVETLKDSFKEEEPVWKKLQDQVETPPTQADKLKEQGKKEDSLMDRLNKREDKSQIFKKEDFKEDIKEIKEEPKKEILELAREEAKEVETIFNRASEEKEENATPSVLEAAGNTDNKPSSLVDLLKSKEKENEPVKLEKKEVPVKKEEPLKKEESTQHEDSPSGSLLDRFRQQTSSSPQSTPGLPNKPEVKKTLVDKLKNQPTSPPTETVGTANTPKGKTVKTDEIPIHKQYRYVQKVFGGNNVRFRIIVDKISNAKSSREVEEILEKYVFSNADVNREDETVKEFINLMRGQ